MVTREQPREETGIPSNYALDRRLLKLELIVERQSAIVSKLMWIVVAAAVGLITNALPTILSGILLAVGK